MPCKVEIGGGAREHYPPMGLDTGVLLILKSQPWVIIVPSVSTCSPKGSFYFLFYSDFLRSRDGTETYRDIGKC